MRKPYQNFKSAQTLQSKLISQYQQQIALHQQLLLAIRSVLPENLGKQVSYAVWKQNKATLFTPSPAFATQLRFYANAVQDHLTAIQHFCHIEQVQIRIIVAASKVELVARQAKIPSGATIQFLNTAANNRQPDLLQQALQKLNKTLEQRAQQQDLGN